LNKNQKFKKKIYLIAGVGFLKAYSGTLYLIQSLEQLGCNVKVIVQCNKDEKFFYKEKINDIILLTRYDLKSGFARKILGLFHRITIIYYMLKSTKTIITEGTWLVESSIIKRLKPKSKIIQYSQELWLIEDHPWSKQAKLYEAYSKVSDRVIDVEPNRAMIRLKRFNLQTQPYVLFNTIPNLNIEFNKKGSLEIIANCTFPENIPIILYTGSVGVEKPFERIIDAIAPINGKIFLLAFCSTSDSNLEKLLYYASVKLKKGMYCIKPSIQRDLILESTWECDIGIIDYTYSVIPTQNQKFCAPTKLFEYMFSGLAIVGSNNPSLKVVIEKNGIGKCADGDSIECLTEAISYVISSEIKKMKSKSKKVFQKKYCYEQINIPVVKELIQYFNN